MRTDGDLKVVVTISASINAHPTESSRKGHSLKSILWYLKLTQKLLRKNLFFQGFRLFKYIVLLQMWDDTQSLFGFFPEGRGIDQISYVCHVCPHVYL